MGGTLVVTKQTLAAPVPIPCSGLYFMLFDLLRRSWNPQEPSGPTVTPNLPHIPRPHYQCLCLLDLPCASRSRPKKNFSFSFRKSSALLHMWLIHIHKGLYFGIFLLQKLHE